MKIQDPGAMLRVNFLHLSVILPTPLSTTEQVPSLGTRHSWYKVFH